MSGDGFSEQAPVTERSFSEHNKSMATITSLLVHLASALFILSALILVYITVLMFFDTLLNVANRAIKDTFFLRPAQSSTSEQRMLHGTQPQSPSSNRSPKGSFSSVSLIYSVKKVDMEGANTKKPRFSSRTRCPLFGGGKACALQPQIFGTTLEEDESYKPSVALHHPHSKSSNRPDMQSFGDDSVDPSYYEETPSSSSASSPSPVDDDSDSSSLVPTVIITRSPSPQPHPCIDQARELGIKVRDFAHEHHDVPLAPTIPDIDQLKVSYYLYRSAGLTPPTETMDYLQNYDPEWFIDVERRYETSPGPKLKPENPVRPWRRQSEPWRGVDTQEPQAVDNVVPWLETIIPQNDSQNEEVPSS